MSGPATRDHMGDPSGPYEAALDALAKYNASVDPLYLMRLRAGLFGADVAYTKALGTELRRAVSEAATPLSTDEYPRN